MNTGVKEQEISDIKASYITSFKLLCRNLYFPYPKGTMKVFVRGGYEMNTDLLCKLIPIMIVAVLVLSIAATYATLAQTREVVLYTHGWWQPPPARRLNPFAPKSIRITGLIYERLAFWNKLSNTYTPELAVNWKIDKERNEFIVYLRKNVYWHDGQPFTCKDVWTTLMLYKLFNYDIWKYISSIECKDDYTVVYHIKKWSYLLPWYILWQNGLIVGPYHIYGKFAEEVAKATSAADLDKIRKELVSFKPKTIVGTGPFMFKSITSSQVVLVKFPKYWAADRVYVDKIIMPYITSNQVGWEYYRAGKLDYDCFMMPPQVKEELEKKPFAEIVTIYDLSGFALVFNFKNPYLRKLEVRQAIAYVLDRQKIADAAGKGLFDPIKYPTGLINLMNDMWVKDLIDKGVLNSYNRDVNKAKQLLEKAGFTYKNGQWYTPDGKPFTLTLIAPGGWTDWDAAATEIAQELNAFGIKVTLKTPESPSYWSDQWFLGGNYDLAIDFYGVWMTYPWKAFHRIFIEVNGRPKSQVQGSDFAKFFSNVYLPYFKTTVDATKLVNELAVTFNKDEQVKLAEKLAYMVNYYLPEFPIADKKLLLFANKGHFIWPDSKQFYELWQNAAGGHLEALAHMIKLGLVVPNPKFWGVTVTTVKPTIISKTVTVPTTTTVVKTTTTATTVATTVTAASTTTVTQTVTATKTVPTTVVSTTTVTKQVTTTNWGLVAGLFIIGLIIGIGIGWAIKRRPS